MNRRPRTTTTAAACAALLLALTACGPAAETPIPGTQAGPAAGAEIATAGHSHADVDFAQMMIVHHEGAIEMADLAVEPAGSEDVRSLAAQISAAQGPEIDRMSGWLEEWGEPRPADADMHDMDHGAMEMDGMDQETAMATIRELDGAAFDRAFLELMIEHHRGAVDMAETELDEGEHPDARELAEAIIADQTAEIAEMERVLDER